MPQALGIGGRQGKVWGRCKEHQPPQPCSPTCCCLMSLEPLFSGTEWRGTLTTSYLQTGTELLCTLEKQQEEECSALAVPRNLISPTLSGSIPVPSRTFNKGKAFPSPGVRWIGLGGPSSGADRGKSQLEHLQGWGQGSISWTLSDQVLGLLCPASGTTASPGRAVSGNLRLGCWRKAGRREYSSRMSFPLGSTLCFSCKSTILCHNSDCSCCWPQAQSVISTNPHLFPSAPFPPPSKVF